MCPSVHHSPHHSLLSPGLELNVHCHLSPSLCCCFSNQRVVRKAKYFESPRFQQKWKKNLLILPACPWVEPPDLLYRVARVEVLSPSSPLPQLPPSWLLSHHIYWSSIWLYAQDRSRYLLVCLKDKAWWAKKTVQTERLGSNKRKDSPC